MIRKPRPAWTLEEGSPWAGRSVRPTVWEDARAYPGVALGNVPMAAIPALFVAAPIIFVLNWIVHAVAGLSLISYSGRPTSGGVVLICVVLISAACGLWWVGMYGLIRGWWTDGGAS